MDVAQILKDSNILITGSTGFVGICLLEKILRSVDVAGVFLMMRPKNIVGSEEGTDLPNDWRQKSVQTRLQELLKNPRFDSLRSEGRLEKLMKKCHPIAGDLLSPELGVIQADRDLLKSAFSKGNGLCIHVAANTTFDQSLNEAIGINVDGSSKVLDLCEEIGVKAFVHTSTLYVNAREHLKARIFEKLYKLEYDPVETYSQWLESETHLSDEQSAALLAAKHASEWPNTYCFTKSMAEHIVTERCKSFGPEKRRLPLSIVRPGIVGSAMKEGFGWFHGKGGFLQIFVALGRRIITILPNDGDCWPDNIPVDICANAIIVSAAKLLTPKPDSGESSSLSTYPHIFHLGSAHVHPDVTLNTILSFWLREQKRRKEEGNPLPGLKNLKPRFIPNETRFWIEFYIFYDLPYFLLKPFASCSASLDRLTNLLNKCRKGVRKFLGLYQHFLSSKWIHDMTNTITLWKELSAQSQSEFNFDLSDQDLVKYICDSGLAMWWKRLEKQGKSKKKISDDEFGLQIEKFISFTKKILAIFFVAIIAIFIKTL